MNREDREKRAYCQAFDDIHIPQPIDAQNVNRETRKGQPMNWLQKNAAALGAAAVLFGSTGAAYAADLGGIRTTVTLWLDGKAHEAEMEKVDDNTWAIREKGASDSEYTVKSSGGVFIDEDGVNYGLEAQDVAGSLAENVAKDDKGRFWLSFQDKKADVTDCFDDKGQAFVQLGGRYFELKKSADGCEWSSYDDPQEGISYQDLN